MEMFSCLQTEVYTCAVHVGQWHLAQSTSQSGQASSILLSSERQIGCHKPGLIALCCSLQRAFRPGEAWKQTHKQCVWDTVAHAGPHCRTVYCTCLHKNDSFIYHSCQSKRSCNISEALDINRFQMDG